MSLGTADKFGWTLLTARRYDEAINQFRSVLEMNPNYRQSRWGLARTYELKGMYNKAIEECRKIPVLPNIDSYAKSRFKIRCSLYEKVYTSSDSTQINRWWFDSARQEIKDAINRYHDTYYVATLYAAIGEHGESARLVGTRFPSARCLCT